MDQNQAVGSERHTTPLFLSPYELDRKRWLSRRTAATATSRLGFHPFIHPSTSTEITTSLLLGMLSASDQKHTQILQLRRKRGTQRDGGGREWKRWLVLQSSAAAARAAAQTLLKTPSDTANGGGAARRGAQSHPSGSA
ncbi:hypothetical protein CHARACLAT_003857 [Characodon lateralis]|uniref:Uncharacterized protein n=1 Tax=Characodon lateralis TaxID=208331 RepID=A0ABU7ERU0_9TELE|nr:hypothetical protein [Characodon lateralis]